jgi:phenylpyruvate tautomerase PptA (4-oxalocrotonate tautomerase family)
LPGKYSAQVKRELATRLCKLYAEVMETQTWRPNVGIAELGADNLYRLGADGLEPVTMVLVEFRRGRSPEQRLTLGRAIVDVCVELLGVPRRTVLVEFTPHDGDEMLRDGNWAGGWTAAEGSAERPA